MGHGIPVVFQCLDHAVTHVTHKNPNKTLGDGTSAAGQHMASDWGGLHVSGGNKGKYGSHGSHESILLTYIPMQINQFSTGPSAGGRGRRSQTPIHHPMQDSL
jgi:hypothetical protein